MSALTGYKVCLLAVNLPGPLAGARLRDLGADVTKIEPPQGDQLQHIGTGWYERLTANMTVRQLNIKETDGRQDLENVLSESDLLLTSYRPASLARLGLDWETVHANYPELCYVAIVGFPPPRENIAGHDLTYQAGYGMLTPPAMPRVLVADLAGAERAAATAIELLLARERGQGAAYKTVALSDAASGFAETIRQDITTPGGPLGGGLPNYNIYETKDGYLAVAALEMHFFQRMIAALECADNPSYDRIQEIFFTRTAEEWEAWADEHDLPFAAVRAGSSTHA